MERATLLAPRAPQSPQSVWTFSDYISDVLFPRLQSSFETAWVLSDECRRDDDFVLVPLDDSAIATMLCERKISVPVILWVHDVHFPESKLDLAAFCSSIDLRYVIFSSARLQQMFAQKVDCASSLPQTVLSPPVVVPILERRRAEANQPTVLLCGAEVHENLAAAVFAAVERSAVQWRVLWVVGHGETSVAEAMMRSYPGVATEIVVGKNPHVWRDVLSRAHLACHLSFSAVRDISPFAVMSLASAVPVVALRFGWSHDLEKFAAKIPTFLLSPGKGLERELGEVLAEVATTVRAAGDSLVLGAQASEYIAEQACIENTCLEIRNIVEVIGRQGPEILACRNQ